MRQLRVFQSMVARGLIYRDFRPVHYSPSSRSALAEAELVYRDDHISHAVFVRFALAPHNALEQELGVPVHALVWTTTPWTLTANMVRGAVLRLGQAGAEARAGHCIPPGA
jgi:isoleucyl-tRNA synthetase